MNYRRNNRKKWITVVVIVVIATTIFYFFRAPLDSKITATVQNGVYPLFKAGNMISERVAQTLSYFASKEKLQEENILLKERVETQRLLLMSKEALFNENQELKERLGRRSEKDLILAAILSRPDSSPYDTLIIDVGEDMVSPGDRVSIAGEIILGTIMETYTHSSKVVLLSSTDTTTEVLLENTDSEDGFISTHAQGVGGGNFKIELPRDVSVKEGSIVYIPGLSLSPIAVIGSIEKTPNDSFQTIYARALVNMQNIRWVEVENL